MTKFGELYDYCQSLTPKVSRKHIKKKTFELTNSTAKVIKSGLDTTKCRGLFISMGNDDSGITKKLGSNVIVLARSLNYCWERFVETKELMHLFDTKADSTGDKDSFEKLLTEFGQPALVRSDQIESEVKAFWMALACLCPEKYRLEFKSKLDKKHMDNYAIALQLRIPEQYVPSLFAENYLAIIKKLLS